MDGVRRRGSNGASRARVGQDDPPPSASIVVTDYAFRDAAVTTRRSRSPPAARSASATPPAPAATTSSSSRRQPTTCKQTAGDIWLPAPPLPWYQQGPGWAGTCTFAQPGTYEFHSGLNFDMRGTVVVGAPTPTPTPTADAHADGDAHGHADATPRHAHRDRTPATATRHRDRDAGRRRGIDAHDTASPRKNWFQDAASSDPADNSVTVTAGETVDVQLPGRRGHELGTTSCSRHASPTSRRRRGPRVPVRSRHRAADAGLRAARGLGGRLHVRHARHVHVRLLGAPWR